MTTQSIADRLAGLPDAERRSVVMSLSERQALAILYDWRTWARPNQLPPIGDWFCWLLRSGRGFGKTRTGAEWVLSRVRDGFRRIALVGETAADVRDTMIELGDSSIMAIAPPWLRPQYQPSKRRLVWASGAIATAYAGDEPDQLRGPQNDSAWVDELAKFRYPLQTWDNLEMGLRIGKRPQVVVTTTPRPIPIIKRILADPRTVDVQGHTQENARNLSPAFMQRIMQRYGGTRLGRQELAGEILEDNPGALWTHALIEAGRVVQMPDLVRVVVGVDPEATTGDTASETGIVVAGIGQDGHGYVLADATIQGTPDVWGKAAVSAFHQHRADRIVAEVNQGGDMVEFVLRTISPLLPITKVHAIRGKLTRAEPVSALYEQKRVHHVGFLPLLEDQMCEWVPGGKSPDRMDALVWALTELMLPEEEPQQQTVVYYDPVRVSPI